MKQCWSLSIILAFLVLGVQSFRCEKENIFDNTEFFSCPGPQDSPDKIFCCGNKLTRFCCSSPSFDDDSIGKNLAKLIGIIIGVAIFVVVVCVVCCCCCPFCFFAKRRHRGHVIRTNAEASQQPTVAGGPGVAYAIPPEQFVQQQQQQMQPQMQYPMPAQSPMAAYPVGGAAYPPAPGMIPYQPGMAYPPPGGMMYPEAGYSMAPGYVQANPPPYPGLADQPTQGYNPQTEKVAYQTQPAYNPNY